MMTSTDQLTCYEGAPVRLWEGVTERGVRCKVFVRAVAVRLEDDRSQFERELQETLAPGHAVDLRQIL